MLPAILGNGHFGSIRLARLIKDPTKVFALKTILKASMENQHHLMIQELEILKAIDHPNIVKFYETYQDEENFYIVMEYCSGGDLLSRLEKGPITEDGIHRIMKMALSAVKFLHEKGVVHRDLKLENFLYSDQSEDAEIKLIDFGLATRINPQKRGRLNSFVGTAFYVAPEVINSDYDEKCDEWSLGVMMYILFTQRPPFQGRTDSEIFQNIQDGYFSLDGKAWTNVTPLAKDLIRKLLTEDATKRLSAAQALEHPWITLRETTDKNQSPRKRLQSNHSDVVNNIRTFESRNRFRKEVLKVMVTLLSDEETKKLTEAFRIFDINNTGEVTVEELYETMNELGYNYTLDEIKRIIRGITLNDKEDCIKYTDFLFAAMDTKALTMDKLQVMFKYFDVDDSNYITPANIKETMARAGRKIDEKEIEDMIRDGDIIGDGRINFQEFCVMMGVGEMRKSVNGEFEYIGMPRSLEEVPDEKIDKIEVLSTVNVRLKGC